MKKTAIIILTSVVGLFLTIFLLGEWWVESVLGKLINENPDRSYDITYQDLDLHTLFSGITLESAKVTPLVVSDSSTVINGVVQHIELNGVKWLDFLFDKKADIREVVLIQPEFEVMLVTKQHQEKKAESTRGFQGLFGDILTRGVIHNFRLKGASVVARHKSDSMLVAKIMNYNLQASEIQTDSIRAKSLIPFKVGSITSSLDSGYFHVNEYTEITTGRVEYNAENSELQLNKISMNFTKDLMEVSDLVGEQTDLIQMNINQLLISQIDAQSSLYHDLEIRARTILIDGLVLKDFRDKNKHRPPDVEKPMFSGIVRNIPIPFKIDSIIINNSEIYYSELVENKLEAGTVGISNINGAVVNITNIPQFQEQYNSFTASIQAKLNQKADTYVNLKVPYEGDAFSLHTVIDKFELSILSPTVAPMAGIEIKSGIAHKIEVKMNTNGTEASNVLTFDYEDLGLELLNDHKHDHHKKALVSFIANSAIRHHNMPDHGHYVVADYQSFRNIYRGPFNFMWESAKEGMLYIVPTGTSSMLLGDPEKKAKKAQANEDGKHHQKKERKKKKAKT